MLKIKNGQMCSRKMTKKDKMFLLSNKEKFSIK